MHLIKNQNATKASKAKGKPKKLSPEVATKINPNNMKCKVKMT